MSRSMSCAFALLLASCGGSAPAIPPIANSANPVITQTHNGDNTSDYRFSLSKEDRRARATVPGDSERVSRAVHTAFLVIGVPAVTLSRSPRVIGTERFLMRRSFGGKPVATYVDCGMTNTGTLANVYRVQSAFLASVHSVNADSATIEVRVTAQAFTNEGASGGGIDCTTTGYLERRLIEETKVALAVARSG